MANKEFEIIVFGATSFVGKIVCNYLVHEHREPNLRWAMAARSEVKLRKLKASLGQASVQIPLLVVDAGDESALRAMCERTAVIISTVGPYALYGEPLVRSCVSTGTDYCDLTGEPQWIRRMIHRYHAEAVVGGARIVHCCGFDSIPSDLGVKYLQQQAMQQFGSYCSEVKMRVKNLKGGASGGTIASMLNLYDEMDRDHAVREQMTDIFSLCPADFQKRTPQQEIKVLYDKDFGSWAGPFVMAAINTRVVLRSNALRLHSDEQHFSYDEGTLTGLGRKGEKRARRLARGTGLLMRALSITLLRGFIKRFVVPKPGTGPSPEAQLTGCYDLRFFGRTAAGQEISVQVTDDRDPGYGATARILAQSALCLCREVDKEQIKGGFWTPATVFGDAMFARLRNFTGMRFNVQKITPEPGVYPQKVSADRR